MSNRNQALAQGLTGKASIEDCTLEEVQQITQRFPFFAPAQFLLHQKLKQTGSEDLEAQYRKAALYYPDPLQFELFISSDQTNRQPTVDETYIPEQTLQDHTFGTYDGRDELGRKEMDRETAGKTEFESNILREEHQTEQEVESIVDPLPEPGMSSDPPNQFAHDTGAATVTVNEIFDAAQVGDVSDTVSEIVVDQSQSSVPEKEETLPINVQQALPADLAFEPYYTVDYFASQGIKVSPEDLVKDKLGKQVKSFTEWLKTMKRLPAASMPPAIENNAEKAVENMATTSVSDSDVVTEAMAEVWAKQGNRERAAETYNKLSLLNPAKKAFFAAKIEHLKTL